MKNYILLLCTVFFALPSFSQSGFYLQPAVGIGQGQANFKYPGGSDHYSGITATNYQLGIGYQAGQFRFSTGVSYLRTGLEETFLVINSSTLRAQEYYHHILIPVVVSYQAGLSKRFSLTPAIGIDISDNINTVEKVDGEGKSKMPDGEFSKLYNKLSIFGYAGLHAEYKIDKKLSVFAGPSAHLMLSNMEKAPPAYSGFTSGTLHTQAFLFDAGVIWHLHKHAKKAAPVKN